MSKRCCTFLDRSKDTEKNLTPFLLYSSTAGWRFGHRYKEGLLLSDHVLLDQSTSLCLKSPRTLLDEWSRAFVGKGVEGDESHSGIIHLL